MAELNEIEELKKQVKELQTKVSDLEGETFRNKKCCNCT